MFVLIFSHPSTIPSSQGEGQSKPPESVAQDLSVPGPSSFSQSASFNSEDSTHQSLVPESLGPSSDNSEVRRRRLEKFTKENAKEEGSEN